MKAPRLTKCRCSARCPPAAIYGEIYVCVDEALIQARRFGTSWPSELARYIVHGVLHLLGYDDSKASKRRRMKREENRLLKALSRRRLVSPLYLR